MTKQKSLIGTELDCTFRTIEASQVNRLDGIFNQPNSTLIGKNQESNKGLIQLYPSFLLGNLINLPKVYKALGLNINNVLLSRESIISHKLPRAGDSIAIRTFLRDAYEQQASSNPIGFIILESVGLLNNDLLFYGERVIAVRGGFHRGRPA
jgi:hypothetical protein